MSSWDMGREPLEITDSVKVQFSANTVAVMIKDNNSYSVLN